MQACYVFVAVSGQLRLVLTLAMMMRPHVAGQLRLVLLLAMLMRPTGGKAVNHARWPEVISTASHSLSTQKGTYMQQNGLVLLSIRNCSVSVKRGGDCSELVVAALPPEGDSASSNWWVSHLG